MLSLKLDILETERLIIRPFAPDDLDDIHLILNEAFGTVAGVGGHDPYGAGATAPAAIWGSRGGAEGVQHADRVGGTGAELRTI